MSLIGLSYLADLKAYLLPEQLRADTDYDAIITHIGKGVAAQFDRTCRRGFVRTVAAVDTFGADRTHWIAERYPLEEVTSVQIRHSATEGWLARDGQPNDFREESGIIDFGAIQGSRTTRLRVTYTGGYWVPASADDVQPAGSIELPDDLKLAWLQQCQNTWMRREKMGESFRISDAQGLTAQRLANLMMADLLPSVATTLTQYRRQLLL